MSIRAPMPGGIGGCDAIVRWGYAAFFSGGAAE
jgi:hypothetical protein